MKYEEKNKVFIGKKIKKERKQNEKKRRKKEVCDDMKKGKKICEKLPINE